MLMTLADGGQSKGVCRLKLLENLLLGIGRHEELGELTIDGEAWAREATLEHSIGDIDIDMGLKNGKSLT